MIVLLALAAVSCSWPGSTPTPLPSGPAPSTTGSGIEGTTVSGPTCPNQPVRSACPNQPLQATLQVLGASGRVVVRFKSGEDGHFKVSLPPAIYTLGSADTGAQAHARPQTVTVVPGKYTQVGEVVLDSGIR